MRASSAASTRVDRRIAQPRALRAGEQRADRHDRQLEAEREPLRDARRRAQAGERAGAGSRTRSRRSRRARGRRRRRVRASRAKAACSTRRRSPRGETRRAVAGDVRGPRRPDVRRRDVGEQKRDRAEFGRRIEGEQNGACHSRYCNAGQRRDSRGSRTTRCDADRACARRPRLEESLDQPRRASLAMIVGPISNKHGEHA